MEQALDIVFELRLVVEQPLKISCQFVDHLPTLGLSQMDPINGGAVLFLPKFLLIPLWPRSSPFRTDSDTFKFCA
jgi:hypothetical protein